MQADRGFAQGEYAEALRADQKSFGSNRSTGLGDSQSSEIIKWIQTTTGGTSQILTLDLEPWKAYSLLILVTAKHRNATDAASWSHVDQLAFLDAAASGANLVPAAGNLANKQSSGTGATLTAALSISGDNVRVDVTGNVGETWEWTCSMRFVEAYVA